MNFIGFYNKSVWLTFLGMALSIAGIAYISDIKIAMLCLIGAGICDLFDGFIARKIKRTDKEKEYGVQLDSLVDVVSFLVFPSVFFISINHSVAGVLIAVLYMFCGITRLAWFNITTFEDNKTFTGVPVTYIALLLPLYSLSHVYGAFNYYKECLCGIYVIMAILFISNIKIKKPRGVWYGIFSLIAIGSAVLYFLSY